MRSIFFASLREAAPIASSKRVKDLDWTKIWSRIRSRLVKRTVHSMDLENVYRKQISIQRQVGIASYSMRGRYRPLESINGRS